MPANAGIIRNETVIVDKSVVTQARSASTDGVVADTNPDTKVARSVICRIEHGKRADSDREIIENYWFGRV